jgi:hypothetical protein
VKFRAWNKLASITERAILKHHSNSSQGFINGFNTDNKTTVIKITKVEFLSICAQISL